MLSQKVIAYLKLNNSWFDEIEPNDYEIILEKIGININSDFGKFYACAEEYAGGFHSKDFELWQICWMYDNGDYLEIRKIMNKNLSLSDDYYILSEFEGEAAYFYNKTTQCVELIGYSESGIKKIQSWSSFNNFLEWYFNLN
ncbi:hypothetical protein [Acinetobacter larvae]|uniref:SMI1/KNR4 family protein n=1 Tax=Acinetobacter larvae TaxID=1789224 RepID=A0A1B2M2P2_9GAMM|nr:hypothetical protein [Acinetobacter larvae]AOA59470.1 hypothetical protein BFG52_14695 [Acinetobacter larvae]